MTLTQTKSNEVKTAISTSFTEDEWDGFWYPAQPGKPLVRICLADTGYVVERRRDPNAGWLPVATVSVEEFDLEAWETWRSTWPMVQPV